MSRNTPIMMHDGTIKLVQDILVGDQLMGDDSTPRNVLSLAAVNTLSQVTLSNHLNTFSACAAGEIPECLLKN